MFTKDLEHAIMACFNLMMCFAVIKEALYGVIGIRDTYEATHHHLKTQLEKFRLVDFVVVKIQTKVVAT